MPVITICGEDIQTGHDVTPYTDIPVVNPQCIYTSQVKQLAVPV